MKRMKALLGVVLCIALVLSLSLTAFAAGTIKVSEPGTHSYNVYKVFDATITGTAPDQVVEYYTENADLAKAIMGQTSGIPAFTDLILTETSTGHWTVKKTNTYSAAEFAEWLLKDGAAPTGHDRTTLLDTVYTGIPGTANSGDNMKDGVTVTDNGYYFISYDNFEPYALTSVLDNTVSIQNKKDIPFDKDVYSDTAHTDDIDKESVEGGQTLYYVINGKVPAMNGNTSYNYKVWDILGEGLQYQGDVAVTIGSTVTLVSAQESIEHPVDSTPKGAKWENTTGTYTNDRPTFVVNLDLTGYAEGTDIVITYSAKVTADLGVLVNTAHLVSNDLIKDAQTENYTSKIVVDKFETGNASQKLQGAKFILAKDDAATVNSTTGEITLSASATYYKFDSATNTVSWGARGEAYEVTTDEYGAAEFTGLKDGTYYLVETQAPVGYVMLDTPVAIIVNGEPALDPQNTVKDNPTATKDNQEYHLQNVSHIANTPGSVLPSTGGRGTTMLYMAGLGMMLAAGAFLIFRRRAEAGK